MRRLQPRDELVSAKPDPGSERIVSSMRRSTYFAQMVRGGSRRGPALKPAQPFPSQVALARQAAGPTRWDMSASGVGFPDAAGAVDAPKRPRRAPSAQAIDRPEPEAAQVPVAPALGEAGRAKGVPTTGRTLNPVATGSSPSSGGMGPRGAASRASAPSHPRGPA